MSKKVHNKATELDQNYRNAMGWEGSISDEVISSAFIRAHQIRQFEIELYWKRANYFWLVQAATLTAFGLLLSAEDKAHKIPLLLPLAIACLGFLCALAGWLSAKGSKFWQSNWEKHIDMLEDNFEGKLHKTVWIGSKGVSQSVSRLNSDLIFCFCLFWAGTALMTLLSYLRWRELGIWPCSCGTFDKTASGSFLLIVVTAFIALRLYTRWTDFDVKNSNQNWFVRNLKKPNPAKQKWLSRSNVTGDNK